MNTGNNSRQNEIPLIDSFDRRDFLISRILSGTIRLKVNDEIITFVWPDRLVRYEALELYQQILSCQDMFEESDMVAYMIEHEMWSFEEEDLLLKKIPEDIDNFKIEMFNNILNTPKRESFKKMLNLAKIKNAELWSKRNKYYYITAEGIGAYAKQILILEKCINNSDANINKVFEAYQDSIISEDEMRILARTEPWRGIWISHKKCGTLFPSDLNEEQRRLVQWSCFYDSIYENPESPTDEIINDDDLLDGWVLKQRKERADEKEKQFGKSIIKGKNEKADEMFIVVGNQEDAKKVYKMNSPESKMIQKSRLNAVLKSGEVKEAELPDRKMEIRNKLTQMEMERFRR